MLRLLIALSMVLTAGAGLAAAGDLAPTGTLRAAFLGTNPVQARVDTRTGVVTGPVPDLVRELARRLNVPYRLIPAPDVAAVIAHLQGGTADIGFMAFEASRAQDVEFAGGFAMMPNTYLVRTDSPMRRVEDVDREGVAVGMVRLQSQALYLTRRLGRARIVLFDQQPSQREMERLLGDGTVTALALNTQRAIDGAAASGGALRALDGSYVDVEQAFVLRKGRPEDAARIDALVNELRASGFLRASLDRAGLAAVQVSPGRPFRQPGER